MFVYRVLSGCHLHEILGCVSKCTLFSFLDLLLVCREKVAGFHLRSGESNHWNLHVKRNVSANNSRCFSLISLQMADRPLGKWIRLVNAGRFFRGFPTVSHRESSSNIQFGFI